MIIEEDEILEHIKYCILCFNITEVHECDKCHYDFCYDCGARSSYHYMFDYNCCALCADQYHYGKNAIINFESLILYNRMEKLKIINEIIK